MAQERCKVLLTNSRTGKWTHVIASLVKKANGDTARVLSPGQVKTTRKKLCPLYKDTLGGADGAGCWPRQVEVLESGWGTIK